MGGCVRKGQKKVTDRVAINDIRSSRTPNIPSRPSPPLAVVPPPMVVAPPPQPLPVPPSRAPPTASPPEPSIRKAKNERVAKPARRRSNEVTSQPPTSRTPLQPLPPPNDHTTTQPSTPGSQVSRKTTKSPDEEDDTAERTATTTGAQTATLNETLTTTGTTTATGTPTSEASPMSMVTTGREDTRDDTVDDTTTAQGDTFFPSVPRKAQNDLQRQLQELWLKKTPTAAVLSDDPTPEPSSPPASRKTRPKNHKALASKKRAGARSPRAMRRVRSRDRSLSRDGSDEAPAKPGRRKKTGRSPKATGIRANVRKFFSSREPKPDKGRRETAGEKMAGATLRQASSINIGANLRRGVSRQEMRKKKSLSEEDVPASPSEDGGKSPVKRSNN